jgi:agmatine/peptidylarginine deiminase
MAIRFPNEGELPCAVLLAWPHEQTDWLPWLTEINHCYRDFVTHLSQHAQVLLLCRDDSHRQQIQHLLEVTDARLATIEFHTATYNDTWIRDYGPITILRDDKPHLLNFQFNAWGGKYQASADNAVNTHLQQQGLFTAELLNLETVMEGGSIDTDGHGSLLTTSQCLITDTRNVQMQKPQWEQLFADRFGIKQTLWLDHGGLIGDDTDSHVDMLARFCDPNTIAYTCCEDESDVHFEPLQQMQQQLAAFTSISGQPYRLVGLPLPKAIIDHGERLPASYANFLILNKAVFVPCYDDPADEIALSRLQECFPEHQIIGVRARALIQQYGSLHCATMQIPISALAKTGNGGD